MAKRANNEGTIYQRSDGRWEARITIGTNPGTGKPIRKSFYGATQKEVKQKMQEAAVKVDKGTYKEPSKLTLKQWLDVWTSEYLPGAKPRTIDSYKTTIRVHIVPALGSKKISEISKHDVQIFINSLSRKEKPLSPKSIKNVHGVLHSALQQAAELDYIPFNPATNTNLPRIEKADIKPLDGDKCKAFINAISGHKFEYVYLVTLFTGMREGEVLGLTWDCVDFEKNTITIKKQLQKERGGSGRYFLVSPKNGKSRRITAAAAVMDILKKQRTKQTLERFKAAEYWHNEYNLVFTNELGENLSAQTVYLHCKKIGDVIGLPALRFHDLRHSFAVLSLRNGDDVKTVQEHLGHYSAAFTLDVYGHLTSEMEEASASRMDAYIKGLSAV